jgi:hypothetical protein
MFITVTGTQNLYCLLGDPEQKKLGTTALDKVHFRNY